MGFYATALLIGMLNGLVLLGLVWRRSTANLANRLLAALIGLFVLRISIYFLGYAGAYDHWRALTFFPLDWSLAFGPLFWGYFHVLQKGRLPQKFPRHFVPAGLFGVYQLVAFLLPHDLKWQLFTGWHLKVIEPLNLVFLLVQQAAYIVFSARTVRITEAPRWKTLMLSGVGLQWLILFAFALAGWLFHPLNYFERFPVMVGYCVLIYGLGLMAWRFSSVADAPGRRGPRQAQDYQALASAWKARVVDEGWYAAETLTLSDLAGKLNVSERTLSRGLADGLGDTFTSFINRMRVEDVMRKMESGSSKDILILAHDAGFASKASFNRAFRQVAAMTPSDFRRQSRLNFRQSTDGADSEAT